jgi:protein O-mannosyl-transferase
MSASTQLVRPEDKQTPARFPALAKTIAGLINANWFRGFLLLAVALLIHSPALQGQRIWDDAYLARDNPFIKSPILIAESFRHYLFLDSLSAHYRPVQNISFIFDYFFWNTDEFGFHLTNVLLHAACGIVLYFLLRRLFESLILARVCGAGLTTRPNWISHAAFLVALLWVVHPVHSAAVDYISGRADSLAFFFAAGGWLLFFSAQQLSQKVWQLGLYSLAAISALLALLSREIGCVWIFLFIAYLLGIEKSISSRRRLCAVGACILLFGIYAGLRQLPAERAMAPAQPGWTAPVRAVLMARALGDYARLAIFPANLHMERTVVDPAGWRSNTDWRHSIGTEYLSILGLGVVAIFVYGMIKRGRGQSSRIFGVAWFLLAYLPISNLFQLNATVAEHWLYLPLVGFFISVFGWAIELPPRYR